MPVQPQKQFIPFYMLEIPFRPHKFLCSSALVSNRPCQPGEELVWGASAVEAEAVFVQVALELLSSAGVGSGQKCFEVAQCLMQPQNRYHLTFTASEAGSCTFSAQTVFMADRMESIIRANTEKDRGLLIRRELKQEHCITLTFGDSINQNSAAHKDKKKRPFHRPLP